ncbi:unnamed protein product, partial [Timema podura]|nr:unnamed protein product [Timema podura]
MAGDSHVDESQLKGLSKYFNSTTLRGRANVAKATYATIGLIILYFTMKPKKKALILVDSVTQLYIKKNLISVPACDNIAKTLTCSQQAHNRESRNKLEV